MRLPFDGEMVDVSSGDAVCAVAMVFGIVVAFLAFV